MGKTAILVDGGFYRVRTVKFKGHLPAVEAAKSLNDYCYSHINTQQGQSLYRIFYYDCRPISNNVYHPLLKKNIALNKTDKFIWMNIYLDELKKKRKFALRMGELSANFAHYNLRPLVVRRLLNGSKSFDQLTEQDFCFCVDQKGVDMRIGLDIASLAYKHQVDQIILISGDSDFVPAAKLARREGIDFILDPMRSPIKPNLQEHIDGIKTMCPVLELDRTSL